MTTRINPLLQPSKSGGSESLTATVRPDVLELAVPPRKSVRFSRTACITEAMFLQSDTVALDVALKRCVDLVDRKTKGLPRAATYYYVTYEAVIDDGGDSGGPMRPPAAGSAEGLVLAPLLGGGRAEAAA